MTKDGTVRGAQSQRPTGILRTLPSMLDPTSPGSVRYKSSIAALNRGRLDAVYIALQSKPKIDVLHLYLIIDGKVHARLNIAGYQPGDSRQCWDRTVRTPKFWAVCTGPVSFPPVPVLRRGFQGFRYTEELW
jgi:hypothetical protein